jgi:hypothetical protein
MVPVSRTIGQGRVVDELILRFTHSIRMDWILPGIEPTGRRVELPFVVIVQFEGNKLAHEHLYWDQASVLVQGTCTGTRPRCWCRSVCSIARFRFVAARPRRKCSAQRNR